MKGVSRRGFLILGSAAGATGAAAAVGSRQLGRRTNVAQHVASTQTSVSTTVSRRQVSGLPSTTSPPTLGRWSDPASWSHGVPGPNQVAVVTEPIMLDMDAHVAGVVIEPAAELIFDPRTSRRLESIGNVVVHGKLVMLPALATVQHRLVFTGANETAFLGGGMDVLPHDVGLWVMGNGALDLAGVPKLAWTLVTGGVRAGATTIELQADPTGWRAGDELILVPTLAPGTPGHSSAFDSVRILTIRGRTITFDRPTRFAHPSVDVGNGRVQTAEVVNLTRNVGIEGVAKGRAHIFIRSTRPQSLKSTVIRHMGPRKISGSDAHGHVTDFVVGRYGLHFHMCDNGSRGSVVESVVVRDAGSHAFVPHQSHGVTFRDCVAFDVLEEPYWWDGAPGTSTGPRRDSGAISNDILYDHCLAVLVRSDPDYSGFNLAGFRLGRGSGNVCQNCAAVGVRGNVNSSGFEWAENEEGPRIWVFRNNVAHNNARHGIFWWQVTARHHTVFDFCAYRNGGAGILNGSYGNNTQFERCTLVQNKETQFFGWAGSGPTGVTDDTPQHLVNSMMDSGGLADYACILAGRSIIEPGSTGRIEGNVFKGARKACVAITFDFHDFGPYPTRWRLEGNTYENNRFWFDDSSHPDTVAGTESGTLRRSSYPGGAYQAAWNAKVS